MEGEIMELLQLKYFVIVARLEHMTRAAEELRIAQPALSKTIATLEKSLGVLLFDRHGKYIRLNQNGKIFLKRVEQALTALENGKRELADLSEETFGVIKLAVIVGSNLLPDLLSSFRLQYPHIKFNVLESFSRSVSGSDFDLCISSSIFKLKDIDTLPLLTEEIFLGVPINHRLATRTSIHLSEVTNDDFISLKPGTALRKTTDIFCQYADFRPNIIIESDSPATVRGLIKSGQGVAFIPAISWKGSTSSSIVLLHIEEPVCNRTISLSWTIERYLPKAARLFRQFTIEYFTKLAYNASSNKK